MQNRSIERMVLLGFSMSLGLILVVSGIAWYSSYNSRDASEWVTHTHEVIAGLENVAGALHKAESAQRGYFVTGQASPYLAERRTAISEMERQLERVTSLTSDSPEQQQQIGALRKALDARVLTLERGLQMYGSPTTVGDMAFQDIFILGTRQMGDVMNVLLRMREQEEALLAVRKEEAQAQHRKENIAFGALVPLVIGLLGFLFYRIRNDMAKRSIAEREQKKLIAILDATPDLVAMADAGMRLSYINRAGRRILGLGENADISQLKISDLSSRETGYEEDRYSVAHKQGSWRGTARSQIVRPCASCMASRAHNTRWRRRYVRSTARTCACRLAAMSSSFAIPASRISDSSSEAVMRSRRRFAGIIFPFWTRTLGSPSSARAAAGDR